MRKKSGFPTRTRRARKAADRESKKTEATRRAEDARDTYWDDALGDGGVRTIKTRARKEWNQGP
jgi:hypothetical protein